MGHIFYDISEVPFDVKIEIINHAYRVNDEWWVDKLDCSESWRREKIDSTYDEIMNKFEDDSHFTIIERYYYMGDNYGEIGFRTMNLGVDYFLWIKISVFDLEIIIDKFNLISKL